jgi:hypothetical protein
VAQNNFIMLMDSVGQEFGQNTMGKTSSSWKTQAGVIWQLEVT